MFPHIQTLDMILGSVMITVGLGWCISIVALHTLMLKGVVEGATRQHQVDYARIVIDGAQKSKLKDNLLTVLLGVVFLWIGYWFTAVVLIWLAVVSAVHAWNMDRAIRKLHEQYPELTAP